MTRMALLGILILLLSYNLTFSLAWEFLVKTIPFRMDLCFPGFMIGLYIGQKQLQIESVRTV